MKILNRVKQVVKAYTEGIYADTPANRKLGRVGMTYAAYNERVKEEEENKKEKKNFIVGVPNGDFFSLTDNKPCSKDRIIEKTIELAKDSVKYSPYSEDECTYDIEEDIDWDNTDENTDFSNKERLQVTAKKKGSKIDITVIDWNRSSDEGFFIRNDELERKQKEQEKKYKEEKEKRDKEFKQKFGWMKELVEFKMKNRVEEALNIKLESVTVRGEKSWTFSFLGKNSEKEEKIKNFFNTEKYKSETSSDYDEELDETFIYIDIKEE